MSTLSQAISASDITSVVVTVTAADMPQARTVSLVKTNGQWSGTVGKLPAGTGRTFTAEAFNGSGVKLYAGTATHVTILAKQTTAVSITLQEVNPAAPYQNAAPVITSLSAAPGTVEVGGVVTLSATASDANPSDTLTYAWTAPSGTFAQSSSLSTTWTASTTASTVPLTLTVTDSKGAQAKVAFNVNVTNGKGDAAVNTSLNTWPQVSNIAATATALELNESTTVSATASDNDGDTLSYSWAASCTGTWTGASTASATFTPTELPSDSTCNNCTLTVTVTDFRNSQAIGGQTTGALSLCVGPKKTATFPPDITETFQSVLSSAAGGTVTFRVMATDPQSSALSFSWAFTTGTLAPPTTSAGESEVVWTAPSCASSSAPAITATVSNALGASTTHTFEVAGLPTCSAALSPVVSAGDNFSLRLTPDGTVWAWGNNGHGQLGDGSFANRASPAPVPNFDNVIAIAAGAQHTVALRQGGAVWTWGRNYYGQLGNGSQVDRSSPMQVSNLNDVIAIAAGTEHTAALRQEGTVWTWGANGGGQLGDRSYTLRRTPVQVYTVSNVILNDVIAIAAGTGHTVALRQDGIVWTWGDNSVGQLGGGNFLGTRAAAGKVQFTLTDIIAIAAGNRHTAALRQDGTVWTWGENPHGQLGLGHLAPQAAPKQVLNLTNVIAIAAGDSHTAALRQDGTVWTWGHNAYGQVGDGSLTNRSSPVQVPNLNNVTAIAAGGHHTMAFRQDGTVWTWGDNAQGQLGAGTGTHHPAPIQVPAF